MPIPKGWNAAGPGIRRRGRFRRTVAAHRHRPGLYRTSDFIVLDEPTAAIDPLEERAIFIAGSRKFPEENRPSSSPTGWAPPGSRTALW